MNQVSSGNESMSLVRWASRYISRMDSENRQPQLTVEPSPGPGGDAAKPAESSFRKIWVNLGRCLGARTD